MSLNLFEIFINTTLYTYPKRNDREGGRFKGTFPGGSIDRVVPRDYRSNRAKYLRCLSMFHSLLFPRCSRLSYLHLHRKVRRFFTSSNPFISSKGWKKGPVSRDKKIDSIDEIFLYRPALRNIILFIQNIYKILEYNDYNLDTVSVCTSLFILLTRKKKEFNYPEKSDSSIGEKEFNSGSIEQ